MTTPNDFRVRPATLDRWEVKVSIDDSSNPSVATITHIGYCDRRRDALWSHTETAPVQGGDWALHDIVLHLALVLSQERPATKAQLHNHMMGQASLFEDGY
jgi:hypothetical protein